MLDTYTVYAEVSLAGEFALADHTAGQEPDRLGSAASQSDVELFAFQLANSTARYGDRGPGAVSGVVGDRHCAGGFCQPGDFVDTDGSGDIEAGETTTVGGARQRECAG